MAKKKANPLWYALGGAGLAAVALYLWHHRYPRAPSAIRPQLATFRGSGQFAYSALQPQGDAAGPSPTLASAAPMSSPTTPPPVIVMPPQENPCGCGKGRRLSLTYDQADLLPRLPARSSVPTGVVFTPVRPLFTINPILTPDRPFLSLS